MAIQRLPVRFAMDRAGLVGADGPTHAGAFDIAYLGTLPGFVLMAPSDEVELMHMVATAVEIDDRPSAMRYPRGEGVGLERPPIGTPLEIGKGRIVKEGNSIAILNFGARMQQCLLAGEKLAGYGLSATIADARFAKPLDHDLIRRLAREHEVLITIEEGAIGGFAAQVMQFLALDGALDKGLKIRPDDAARPFHRSGCAGQDVRSGRPRRQGHRRHRPRRLGPRRRSGGGGRQDRVVPTVMAAFEAATHLARVRAPWTLSLADARAMGGRVKPSHNMLCGVANQTCRDRGCYQLLGSLSSNHALTRMVLAGNDNL